MSDFNNILNQRLDVDFIFFDCMETLIDMVEIPTVFEYAKWAYEGSGLEDYWQNLEHFIDEYNIAAAKIKESLPEYKEYSTIERFILICENNEAVKSRIDPRTAAGKLNSNYWKTYISKCYIRQDVKEVLPSLKLKYGLGVVSNFMIPGGIEELLNIFSIGQYFKFVITSINMGWRKPHPAIYNAALKEASAVPERVLFIGDDYINDYDAPIKMGFNAVLLDKYNKYANVCNRIENFYQLKEILK
mgnify:CR=1 FL=1